MTLQNRVDPWGRLHALAARGTLLGNRGILHNAEKQIVTPSARKGWVTCRLAFEGRRRQVFGAGTYSELFFLDEATAFAAGHRPCAECRRERYNEFKSAWMKANPGRVASVNPPIAEIDRVLHAERARRDGGKVAFDAPLAELPSGTFLEFDGAAYLLWCGKLLRWSFDGYGSGPPLPASATPVRVLTPASVVRVFRAGFAPAVHPSAVG